MFIATLAKVAAIPVFTTDKFVRLLTAQHDGKTSIIVEKDTDSISVVALDVLVERAPGTFTPCL